MNWNGKPTFCPHCGNKTLIASGNESISNSQSYNEDKYACNTCKNIMNISYSPNNFIDIKIKEKK